MHRDLRRETLRALYCSDGAESLHWVLRVSALLKVRNGDIWRLYPEPTDTVLRILLEGMQTVMWAPYSPSSTLVRVVVARDAETLT